MALPVVAKAGPNRASRSFNPAAACQTRSAGAIKGGALGASRRRPAGTTGQRHELKEL